MKVSRGFTLVELLIVVIILGVLAAVVIPQFQGTAAETKESALYGDLSAMRKAISLYRVQHNDVYPGVAGWNEFVSQMTDKTAQDGSAGGNLGPYFRPPMPKNPVTGLDTGKNAATMPAGPDGATGWIYSPANGELRANTAGTGPSGSDYWDL